MDEWVERIRADQRAQWLRGRRVLVEAYLREHPALLGREEALLDLIYTEAVLREAMGEPVRPEEYLERFPHFAAQLRRQFDVHDLLRQSLAPEGPETVCLVGPRALKDTLPDKRAAALEFPTVPGYEILEKLGAGGRGIVYKARQEDLNRLVALKMIRYDEDAAGGEGPALFRREAEAVARLNHPNVVQIYGFGEHQGRPYFAMEYVEGGSLERRLADGPLPPRRAAALAEAMARALHAVHLCGIVHRDLKPGNVLLTGDDRPKVADFGFAKWLGAETSLISHGTIVGTASYMAPEQASATGGEITPGADVYALGAILYHMLTGKPPFLGASSLDILLQVRTREPAPAKLAKADRDLETICFKCLEKVPAKRYASAEELADDLYRYGAGEPIRARPRRWPERAWRAARARPWWAAAALVCSLVLLSLPFVSATPDPNRERRRVEALLAAGKPYVFAGHKAKLGPFRWVVPGSGFLTENEQENCFTVSAYEPCLLELVADPGRDRYRYAVEVRHDEYGDGSEVGLYFGFRPGPADPAEPQFGFYTFSFADLVNFPLAERDASGKEVSRAQVRGRFQHKGLPLSAAVGSPLFFRPAAENTPGRWVRLAVEVSPAEVVAFWQCGQEPPRLIDRIPSAKFEKSLNGLCERNPTLAGIPAEYRPRCALGLFVVSGKASFRRIELEPLPDN